MLRILLQDWNSVRQVRGNQIMRQANHEIIKWQKWSIGTMKCTCTIDASFSTTHNKVGSVFARLPITKTVTLLANFQILVDISNCIEHNLINEML